MITNVEDSVRNRAEENEKSVRERKFKWKIAGAYLIYILMTTYCDYYWKADGIKMHIKCDINNNFTLTSSSCIPAWELRFSWRCSSGNT